MMMIMVRSVVFILFKQKTAYEMRISDWSSDVCSSDLFQRAGMAALRNKSLQLTGYLAALIHEQLDDTLHILSPSDPQQRGCQLSLREIGRASCRERVCQYV